ncbi:DUF4399 domain-containing protein [Mycobacterium sp. GA-2829]|uniref:DUF4399 domain-containing protein n=1 Tax=Mycobacterium sp. GA-2829 TaxID=1772283 RepID=UPI0007402863|nr:DUF4399 domain-containing protein [Mycobacterium sp. GA-2829]KUI37466.1 hypothetical protein AU194_21240 [Mycobacterium sp. GA-2829]
MKERGLLIAVLVLPFVIAACSGSGDDQQRATASAVSNPPSAATRTAPDAEEPTVPGGEAASTKAAAPPRPSITILTPTDGSTARSGEVTVSVSVEDFNVVEQQVRPPFPPQVAGEGHVHFYLDTETLPTTHSPPATGTYRSISETTHAWTGIAPGRHTFAVQLIGNDHAPLSPLAQDQVTITVE